MSILKSISNFYQCKNGLVLAQAISTFLEKTQQDTPCPNALGIGFPFPYQSFFAHNTMSWHALVPFEKGVITPSLYPDNASSVASDLSQLPFPDDMFSLIVLIHALEFSSNPKHTLNELYRILKPEGTLIAIVPNALGKWYQYFLPPHCCGKAFHSVELYTMLYQERFLLTRWQGLFFWSKKLTKLYNLTLTPLQRFYVVLGYTFSGLHAIVVTKHLLGTIHSVQPYPARKVVSVGLPTYPI